MINWMRHSPRRSEGRPGTAWPAYVFAKQNWVMSALLPPTKGSPFPICRSIWKGGEGMDRPALAGSRSRPAASKEAPARSVVQILLGPAGRFAEPCLEEPDDPLICPRRQRLRRDLAGENPAGQIPGVDVDRHRLICGRGRTGISSRRWPARPMAA